jgi:uncharacterized protein
VRLLSIDIENSPHLVWTYKLWGSNVYIAPDMVVKQSEIMCFASKWIGEDSEPMFYSTFHNGVKGMHEALWNQFNEADALVYFNGDRFDRPKIQKELLVAGFDPPSPSKGIDLYTHVKRHFDFPYKRLDEVAKALGLTGKIGSHKANWKLCLQNDPDAWQRMKDYNIQDAILNEQVFDIIKPWIGGSYLPSVALDKGANATCRCGSTNLTKGGFRQTLTGKFQRYRCRACGTWLTTGKSVSKTDLRPESR